MAFVGKVEKRTGGYTVGLAPGKIISFACVPETLACQVPIIQFPGQYCPTGIPIPCMAFKKVIMAETNLTDTKFWEENSNDEFFRDLDDTPVAFFLRKYLSVIENKSALEIGCYPGNFMPTISRLGYTVSGIDFHPKLNKLGEWLNQNNYNCGNLYQGDFFKIAKETNIKYDLVYSLGFIEHFTNWDKVLLMHADLVNKNGLLIITCPNFAGFWQYLYHCIWDKPNLAKHYLPSMNPQKWAFILENNGFEIQYSGYFGGGFFWNENKHLSGISAKIASAYEKVIASRRKVLPVKLSYGRAFECMCGIVAQKK